ncbi:hypothetical protein PtA15_15A472 [Puccinia triticina]|uniref:C2H2-type domain-containing protein n=1 Tax=Puccinia triticina TaxID=208348 RepID=A0ABY7D3A4_9BASI|nr:uncharacterized protein PtA15_15A472 [Puccinia triticina]WAQ92076.1 hypothetical protein PtA15_15A472 [Puccinia triticina]
MTDYRWWRLACYECKQCYEEFETHSARKTHVRNVHQKQVRRCTLCDGSAITLERADDQHFSCPAITCCFKSTRPRTLHYHVKHCVQVIRWPYSAQRAFDVHLQWCQENLQDLDELKRIMNTSVEERYHRWQPLLQAWLEDRMQKLDCVSSTTRKSALASSHKQLHIQASKRLRPLQQASSAVAYSTTLTKLLAFTLLWSHHEIAKCWNPEQEPLMDLVYEFFRTAHSNPYNQEPIFRSIDRLVVHFTSFSNQTTIRPTLPPIQSALEQFIALSLHNGHQLSISDPKLFLLITHLEHCIQLATVFLFSAVEAFIEPHLTQTPALESSQVKRYITNYRTMLFQPLYDHRFHSPLIILRAWRRLARDKL